jgi:DNA-binding transcriptional MerR regulator
VERLLFSGFSERSGFSFELMAQKNSVMAKAKQTEKTGPAIPDKLYFKIGEVAAIVGVKPYVLRYWETEFPDIAPSKSKTNQRLYKRKEVERILRIRDLLYRQKYTIDGARRKLREASKEEKQEGQANQIPLFTGSEYKEFLKRLRGELQELLGILKE